MWRCELVGALHKLGSSGHVVDFAAQQLNLLRLLRQKLLQLLQARQFLFINLFNLKHALHLIGRQRAVFEAGKHGLELRLLTFAICFHVSLLLL